MICDETDLRELARSLKDEYVHLHSLKDARPKPPEVRTMKPAPGPRTPGNWLIVALYVDMEQRLREVAFNAFRDIGERLHDGDAAAPRLCHLIAFHAQAISELDWASDIMDELRDQERTINRRCNPPATTTLRRAERVKQHLSAKYCQ